MTKMNLFNWVPSGTDCHVQTFNRRKFLAQLGYAGAALSAGSWLGSIGYAQTRGPARAIINQARYRSELDRRLDEINRFEKMLVVFGKIRTSFWTACRLLRMAGAARVAPELT